MSGNVVVLPSLMQHDHFVLKNEPFLANLEGNLQPRCKTKMSDINTSS